MPSAVGSERKGPILTPCCHTDFSIQIKRTVHGTWQENNSGPYGGLKYTDISMSYMYGCRLDSRKFWFVIQNIGGGQLLCFLKKCRGRPLTTRNSHQPFSGAIRSMGSIGSAGSAKQGKRWDYRVISSPGPKAINEDAGSQALGRGRELAIDGCW